MDLEQTIDIDAPPERVWAVLADVERWPEWTASVKSIERLDDGPLAVGSRARVRQPRFPVLEWRVTEVEPNRGFKWETRSPGSHGIADHRIEPTTSGSRVTLSVHQTGFLAAVMSPFFAGIGRRYIAMEAQGLKRRSEAGS